MNYYYPKGIIFRKKLLLVIAITKTMQYEKSIYDRI